MKFGVMLPHTNKIASTDAIIRTAETAEEYGFHALSVHDHIVFNGHWIVSGRPRYRAMSVSKGSSQQILVNYAPKV